MSTVDITITLNEETKKAFDEICENAGTNSLAAFKAFIKATRRTKALPLYIYRYQKRVITIALKVFLRTRQYFINQSDRHYAKILLGQHFKEEHDDLVLSKSELKRIRRLKGLRKQRATQTNSKSYRFRERKRLKDELYLCIQNYFSCGHSECFEDFYKQYDELEWDEWDSMVAYCSKHLADYIMKNVYGIDKHIDIDYSDIQKITDFSRVVKYRDVTQAAEKHGISMKEAYELVLANKKVKNDPDTDKVVK